MTTIRPYAAGSYTTSRSTSQLLGLKAQLDRLSTQLSTGRTADTYGGLGTGRSTSLSAHATLSALQGYDSAITAGQTRIKLVSTGLDQITTLTGSLRTSITTGQRSSISSTVTTQLGRTNLDAALDVLGQNLAGQYLFSGRTTETDPVLSGGVILNGDPTKTPKLDGLATLAAEQKAADLGSTGLGRLQIGGAAGATTFSLSEDSTDTTGESRANFGFRIAAKPTATGSAIAVTADPSHSAVPATVTALDHAPAAGESFRVTVNLADGSQKSFDLTARTPVPTGSTDSFGVFGSPAAAAAGLNAFAAAQGGTVAGVQSANTPTLTATYGGGDYAAYDIALASQPAAGDSITVQLALHDGTTTTITLTAKAGATTDPSGFSIGVDPAATTANLKTALGAAIKTAAAGPLSASSTTRASEDFFSASTVPGQQPRRVDTSTNPPTYKDAASSNTVIWYQGDAAATDPRATQTLRAGADLDVAVGARANEVPIQKALAGFAALAVDALADPTGSGTPDRFSALASRSYTLLGKTAEDPSLQAIATDFGTASSALSNAQDRNKTFRTALQSSVDNVESAPIEEVAASLLEVQNRLQASYQITASLAKLSLVNYIS